MPARPKTLEALRQFSSVPLVTALAACGGSEVPASANGAGLGGPDAQIRAELEELYTVGAFEGEDWETFGDVTDVEFDAEGNLHIMDREAGRVVVISRAGEHLRDIGRSGGGPGELGQPIGMGVLGDGRVVIFDMSKQGFQVFGSDGEFLESVPVSFQDGIPTSDLLPTPDGALLSFGGARIRMGAGGEPEPPPPGRPIERWGLDGTHELIYLAWQPPPPEEQETSETASEGISLRLRMPKLRAFEPQLFAVVLPDGRMAVVDSVAWRVDLIGPDGSRSGSFSRPMVPMSVTEEIEAAERARRLASLEDGGGSGRGMMVVTASRSSGGPGGSNFSVDPETVREMQLERVSSMLFADEVPVVAGLAVDRESRIWVERSGPKPGEDGPTDVVTADGEYLGTIPADGMRIPDAFGPGGLVAYIERDELDIERIRVARLTGLLPADG